MALLNMNLTNTQAFSDNFELLPPDEYNVRITDCQLRNARSNGAQYLNLRYDVIDGPKRGRVIFDALSLWSTEGKVREIAASRLKSIGQAIGIANPDYIQDTEELREGEMIVRVGIRKDPEYGDKNVVKAYKPIQGIAVGAAPAQAQAAPAANVPPQQQAAPAQQVQPSENRATPWAK